MPTVDHIGVSRKIGSAEDRSRLRRLVTEAKGTAFPAASSFAPPPAAPPTTKFAPTSNSWRAPGTRSSRAGRAAQGSRAAAPRSQSRRAHPARLRQRRLHRHLDRQRRGVQQGRRIRQPLPAQAGEPRQALHQGNADLRGVRHPAGTRQGPARRKSGSSPAATSSSTTPKRSSPSTSTPASTSAEVRTRLEDTIVKTNLEAVKEIVRQIRLRDLGGIIVVDFIDMEERRNREKVMAALDRRSRAGPRPFQGSFASTNSASSAITRKRTKQALERVLCQPCPYCTGSGMVKSIPTICYEIQAEARKMARRTGSRQPHAARPSRNRQSSQDPRVRADRGTRAESRARASSSRPTPRCTGSSTTSTSQLCLAFSA